MSNYHATSEGNIPFTDEEEAQWAADQAVAAAAAIAAAAIAYKAQRAAEYPSMADYLDGIVKSDTAQVQAYIDACLAVKVKYPKPDAS
jgi:hypothetical protein